MPVEWPIDAPGGDGGPVPARVVGSRRLPCVRADFFLDPSARLTEQERALMTSMLGDLVATLGDELASHLADAEPANDEGEALVDRLWSAGLLDLPDLVALLLRRAEEERIAAGLRAAAPARRPRMLQSLVSDEDADVAAAAMALILAKGRRRDRFDGPRLTFDDVSAETAVALANAVAAARRAGFAKRFGPADSDERLTGAVRSLLAGHDEGNRLEARLFELAHALDQAARLDEALIRSALEEAEAFLLAEGLALKAGISFESAWDHLTGGTGRLALLLRMSGISRPLAGEILARIAEVAGTDPETEIASFDGLSEEAVESARKWLRLDSVYRSAVTDLASGNGQRSL